ncbi:MAG: hypothetical protein AB8B83_02850 [Bdellovibrionales bacterium]
MVQDFGYKANLEAASNAFGSAFSTATSSVTSHVPSENATLLQRVGISVTPPNVDTSAMMRDASNPSTAGDLGQVQQAASSSRNEVMQVRGGVEAAHQEAVGFAVELARDTAPSVGLEAGSVDATFGRACITADIGGLALDATGMGSMATHLTSGAGALGELNRNDLGQEEVKRLADEVAARINGNPTAAQSGDIMQVFVEPVPADFSNASFNLAGCTGDDILELLDTNFEDLQEVVDLDAIIADLDAVDDNHLAVAAAQDLELDAETFDPECAADCAQETMGALIAQASVLETVGFDNPADADLTALALSREAELARAGMAAQFGREATFVPTSSAA